jgi:hypothetical protein
LGILWECVWRSYGHPLGSPGDHLGTFVWLLGGPWGCFWDALGGLGGSFGSLLGVPGGFWGVPRPSW